MQVIFQVSYVGSRNHYRPGVRNYLRPCTTPDEAIRLAEKYGNYRNTKPDSVRIDILRTQPVAEQLTVEMFQQQVDSLA